MLLLQAWLLFPALLALLSLGLGLLVERISASRLPGVLLIPTGLAAIIVIARAAMTWDADGGAGHSAGDRRRGCRAGLGRARVWPLKLDPWATGAALFTFAVFAAPVVLGGSASFAGYTILGDTAVHFVLVDRIASEGTSLAGLDPSSYRQTLEAYFNSGYPLGAHAALGAVRPLSFADVAWVFQPYLAFIAAALALSLVGLLNGIVASRWRRAAIAALAAQPALVYAFAMQGSVKELMTLWLVALFTALAVGQARDPARGGRGRGRGGDRRGCGRLARSGAPRGAVARGAGASRAICGERPHRARLRGAAVLMSSRLCSTSATTSM